MMKRFFLILCLLPLRAFADGLPTQPYIYVQADGEVQRPADQVTLGFSIGFHDRDEATANKKVQAQANKVFALLNGEKIAEKDVVAESISASAEYAEPKEDDPTASGTPESVHRKRGALLGYHVTRSFSVTVRDVGAFPRIVDALLAMNIEEFGSIQAGLSNQAELDDQVREKALANARAQAEKTLKAAQMKIDSIFTISPIAPTSIKGAVFRADENANAAVYPAFSTTTGKTNPAEYRLAPISVSQTIHVIYLISPAP